MTARDPRRKLTTVCYRAHQFSAWIHAGVWPERACGWRV